MTEEQFLEYIKLDFVPEIQKVVKKGTKIFGDVFIYKSLNAKGTKWSTSDHGVLECNIEELLLDYAFNYPKWKLDIDPDYFIEENMEQLNI